MKGKVTIQIEGLLGESWQTLFDDLELIHENGNTVLKGFIKDDAHLHGIFHIIRTYNLTLLSVTPSI